ncbi:MAG: hypothetical protein WCK48_01860 [bacterium]
MSHTRLLKNILIFEIILMIVIFVSYYFVFLDIKSKNENTSVLRNNLSYQIGKQQYMAEMQKTIKNSNSDISQISSMIVSKDGDVAFIESLENSARKNGLDIKIDSLTFDDNANLSAGGLTSLRVKATIKGSWLGTFTFMNELESMIYKVRVDTFALMYNTDADPSLTKKGVKSTVWQSIFEIHVLKFK